MIFIFTGGSFIIDDAKCCNIFPENMELQLQCLIKGKLSKRNVNIPFSKPVNNERDLKNELINMAASFRLRDTGYIASLPFGDDYTVPRDFRFNDVPHSGWVRSYFYDSAASALSFAINDPLVTSKSRMQIKVIYAWHSSQSHTNGMP